MPTFVAASRIAVRLEHSSAFGVRLEHSLVPYVRRRQRVLYVINCADHFIVLVALHGPTVDTIYFVHNSWYHIFVLVPVTI